MALSYEQALSMADQAGEAQEYEEMRRLAEAALALKPGASEALELFAHAAAELGDYAAADTAFATLIERMPDEPALLLAAADVLIRQPGDDRDRLEAGLSLLERAAPGCDDDETLVAELELLRAVAFNQVGECEAALDSLALVLDLDEEHLEARCEEGLALFELGRFDQAKKKLTALTRDEPELPEPWHLLGLIAERRGEPTASFFEKARALAPEDYPAPVELSAAQFDAAVQRAIDALPEEARPHLGNVVITVEPLPSEAEIKEGLSPGILGVFQGVPADERNPAVSEHQETARITLYRKNLERFARTEAELVEQIGVTVLHEVGHLMGLDEDELYDRGLD
jgi:predicted Zn-dependent protease with MMP-like domain